MGHRDGGATELCEHEAPFLVLRIQYHSREAEGVNTAVRVVFMARHVPSQAENILHMTFSLRFCTAGAAKVHQLPVAVL